MTPDEISEWAAEYEHRARECKFIVEQMERDGRDQVDLDGWKDEARTNTEKGAMLRSLEATERARST